MIDEPRLRDGLARLLTATEDNIRRRCDDEATINQPLQDRYESARKAGRTGLTFSVWRENEITQAGVAWLLACVFVRFLEDNDLLGEVYLAGPGGRTKSAMERRTHWYRANPRGNDREYLLGIFSELVRLPGIKGLLDRDHNPLWSLGPDGDGAKAIVDFFQSTDPDSGVLRYDFTDTARSTRFLGDLYQNISESARKRYALLQTPDFIVDFILDRTLTPAVDEFGVEGFRLIDPACLIPPKFLSSPFPPLLLSNSPPQSKLPSTSAPRSSPPHSSRAKSQPAHRSLPVANAPKPFSFA